METTYGRSVNNRKSGVPGFLVVFLLVYIASYFIHLYVLHPIPSLADGSGPDLSTVLAEYPGATLLSEEGSRVVLEQADGSLTVLLLDQMNDRYRLTKYQTTVEAGYTGEVTFSAAAWSDTLVFTDGELTNAYGGGAPWIHTGRSAELVYALVALIFTSLGTCLVPSHSVRGCRPEPKRRATVSNRLSLQ